jgi:hypothetical protein
MEEAFLHFVWNFQQFTSRELLSDSDQKITVFHPGYKNTDAGPDFKNAKIKIGDVIWNGQVEIHINAKDWIRHNHQDDAAYDNVILHVVWKNDASITRNDDTIIPTLEVKNLVDDQLILRYNHLFEPIDEILCKKFMDNVKPITWLSMMDKALVQRLDSKADTIFREIAFTDNDWEEITWRLLCRNFGFKTNTFPFYELAKSLPIKILKREAAELQTVEALMFGQAGFLEEDTADKYCKSLSDEYRFKQKKYTLNRRLDKHQWKFLRLRPANFPTIRIAQLAALVAVQPNLFSLFMDFNNISELKRKLAIEQSRYWIDHYQFGKPSKTHTGKLGTFSIDNILINTVAPLLFAYGIHKDDESLKEKSMKLLASVGPESNAITKRWKSSGIMVKSAFDSQALIELFNTYCLKKRCLNCAIGVEVLNQR